MLVICAWCRAEGQEGGMGEEAPLADRRVTHGICATHVRSLVRSLRDEIGGRGEDDKGRNHYHI